MLTEALVSKSDKTRKSDLKTPENTSRRNQTPPKKIQINISQEEASKRVEKPNYIRLEPGSKQTKKKQFLTEAPDQKLAAVMSELEKYKR